MPAVLAGLGLFGAAACSGAEGGPALSSPSLPVPPPAVSSIDKTVTVKWALADSFDVFPDGTCAGRSHHRGLADGVRALLHGKSTGFYDETTVSAFVKRYPTRMYRGKPDLSDDYRYCVVEAVFAPSMPDPDGYNIKFPNRPEDQLFRISRTRFGRPETPGYGSYNIQSQTCPNLWDPPEMDC